MQYRIVDASQSLAQVQLDLGEQLNQFMEASCNE